jgi:hypothetical protein
MLIKCQQQLKLDAHNAIVFMLHQALRIRIGWSARNAVHYFKKINC